MSDKSNNQRIAGLVGLGLLDEALPPVFSGMDSMSLPLSQQGNSTPRRANNYRNDGRIVELGGFAPQTS